MNKWDPRFLLVRAARRLRRERHSALSLGIGLLAVFIFGAMFRAGIDRGWDQMISPGSYGRTVTGIATVLTQLRSKHHDYAVSNPIFYELTNNRGLTPDQSVLDKLGAKAPDNLRSALFIDRVLDDMWRDVWNMNAGDVRGFGEDDIGIVDYANLAFWLFGHHIRSLYYLLFVILGSSVVVAFIERRRDPAGKLVIIAAMSILYGICFYSVFFEGFPQLDTVTNTRFASVLAVIPALHVLLLMAERARLDLLRAAAVAFQSGVIFFALLVRATAVWVPAGLLVAAMLGAVLSWRARGGRSFSSRLVGALRPQWPALLVLGIVAVGKVGVGLSLHEVYQREGWLTHHVVWHSVYYGYSAHPEFAPKFGALHESATGDYMPMAGINLYLKSHPEQDTPDIYIAQFLPTKVLKYTAMESLARAAFFSFAWQHPRFALETFFIYKPWQISHIIVTSWKTERSKLRPGAGLTFLALLVGLGVLAATDRRHDWFGRFDRFCGLFCCMLPPCLVIPWLTFVDATAMLEQIIAIQIAAAMLFALGIACLVKIARPYLLIGTPAPGTSPREPWEVGLRAAISAVLGFFRAGMRKAHALGKGSGP